MSSGTPPFDHFWAVVPAGGSGTRLWPLSRRSSPKFLHDLTGSGRTLLQQTLDRLQPSSGDRVLVVTGSRHATAVREQLPHLPHHHILVEPSPRDSMPAIGWAAAVLERQDRDAVLGSFAADHVITDPEEFGACLAEAVHAAAGGDLVTLGIQPTHPATGFGYIELADPHPAPGAPSTHRVARFVEKPDRARAQEYLASGRYRWNAGIFVVRATSLLDLLAVQHPDMVRLLRQIAAEPASLEQHWPDLQAISIDHAVAEPAAGAGRVLTIPARFGWDDIGDFASLGPLLHASPADPGIRVLGAEDQVVSLDSTGLVAAHSDRTVVLLGMDDVVVVDTPDAVLVTTRDRVQEVKAIVDALRERGREDLI